MIVARDAEHRYWIVVRGKRREVFSVTRSLIAANLVDDEWFNETGRRRGQLVAHFAEKIATNTVDREIPEDIVGYLVGLRKFFDTYGPRVIGAEVLMADPVHELGGAVDLDLDGLLGAAATVDIKTGKPEPWHGLQLAAYAYLKKKATWLSQPRFGLYLTAAGGFRLKEYDDAADLSYFMRCHDLLRWRIANGTHERPYGRRIDGIGTGILDEDRDGRDCESGNTPVF